MSAGSLTLGDPPSSSPVTASSPSLAEASPSSSTSSSSSSVHSLDFVAAAAGGLGDKKNGAAASDNGSSSSLHPPTKQRGEASGGNRKPPKVAREQNEQQQQQQQTPQPKVSQRDLALKEASDVLASLRAEDPSSSAAAAPTTLDSDGTGGGVGGGGVGSDASTSLDNFNLLGVVLNLTGSEGYTYLHPPNHGHGGHPHSLHGVPGTPGHARRPSGSHLMSTSRHAHSTHAAMVHAAVGADHVSSADAPASSGSASTNSLGGGGGSDAFSLSEAFPDLTAYTTNLDAGLRSATDAVDSLNALFDHYSRAYLGTLSTDENDDVMEEYTPELNAEDVPELQLEELPMELQSLDLTSVEGHLRECGRLSMGFVGREGESRRLRGTVSSSADAFDREEEREELAKRSKRRSSGLDGAVGEEVDEGALKAVPDLFFSPYFDLTDPRTFESLLVVSDIELAAMQKREEELFQLAQRKVQEAEERAKFDAASDETVMSPRGVRNKDSGGAKAPPSPSPLPRVAEEPSTPGRTKAPLASGQQGATATASSGSPSTPSSILTLRKPETFTTHLDAIELSLLHQVRSKSESFFRETNRFSELKVLVAQSVCEVRTLRVDLSDIRDRSVTDVELIPLLDRRRADLRALDVALEGVGDVVDCKSSIASLMGAGDYLGAVEAIRLARSLLVGEEEGDNNDEEETATAEAVGNDQDGGVAHGEHNGRPDGGAAAGRYPLGKLRAMSKVSDQLKEYERLVVSNLSDELVELFLSWAEPTTIVGVGGSTGTMPSMSMSMSPASVTPARRAKVRGIVRALSLCGRCKEAGATYNARLCDLVKVTVRTTVTECAADATSTSLGGGAGGGGKDLDNGGGGTVTTNGPASTGGGGGGKEGGGGGNKTSITAGVTSMSFDQFMNCLEMLFEQIISLLRSAVAANKFCKEEGISLRDDDDGGGVPGSPSLGGSRGAAAGRRGEESNESPAAAPRPPPPTTSPTSPASSEKEIPATAAALVAASDLSHKSVSELLRLRREAHSLVTFDEMKRLWDACLAFTLQLEKCSGQKAYGLRSTLLAQAKAFVERKHEANMASLVAALDSERWTQCDVSSERQAALTRLCSGRAVLSTSLMSVKGQGAANSSDKTENASSGKAAGATGRDKMADAEVEGIRYKVVWSCLLLVEMIMGNVACAAHFQTLATNVVGKVSELLRLFNSRATQLVLGAGAIHSAARLKSINAKHLALVTQCLGLVIAILPHVRAALMAQLPSKQHTLLGSLDKIKKDYADHNEKVLSKFVSIIGGIVEHGLAPRIAKTDFDSRAKSNHLPTVSDDVDTENIACCPFLDSISSNIRKMHQVLLSLLPPEHLEDVFSRIFAYLDQKVPSLFIAAASSGKDAAGAKSKGGFVLPETDEGKRRMVLEVEVMSKTLNSLSGVRPWDFTAMKVLERELEIELYSVGESKENGHVEEATNEDTLGNEQEMNSEANEEGDGENGESALKRGESDSQESSNSQVDSAESKQDANPPLNTSAEPNGETEADTIVQDEDASSQDRGASTTQLASEPVSIEEEDNQSSQHGDIGKQYKDVPSEQNLEGTESAERYSGTMDDQAAVSDDLADSPRETANGDAT